ncbi:pathogenicity locus Cdd1 protein [Fluviicoccus keumensis]|uniref:Pathogenicity locus Cdd1 protein n=1 Tax=Fluviicoccus keumensis TaxID=1435465 RepID=A0A4Q7ZCS1_9GAMM|nr:helix-hairpin-helix domain-containing protein [Fluviicoccus keumensis]RZU48004.1 pathogenicity locus Cdd1 protein [Fluviicoccus keumensis]
MNPAKVMRERVRKLTDLPNVGKAVAGDLQRLGITEPGQLAGCCPLALYDRLAEIDGVRSDPCMLDTFMSVIRFIDGEEARPWWDYTAERKAWMDSLGR